MGRRLSEARRAAAIAAWRDQLLELSGRTAPSLRVELRELLGSQGPDATRNSERRLNLAVRELPTLLQLALAGNTAPLDAWIGRRLVDVGPQLLIDLTRRRSQLASLRDRDRRARRTGADDPRRTVTVSKITAVRLQKYVADRGLRGLDAGIALLLDGADQKRRTAGPTRRPAAQDDLFSQDHPRPGSASRRPPKKE